MIANADTIKSRVTIEDVLVSLGYALDSRGRCACPVHGGSDRNFSIKNGSGTCFSQCGGKSWDAPGLLMEVKQFTYPEALEYLANIGGVQIEYASGSNRADIIRQDKEQEQKREQIYQLNERALQAYQGGVEVTPTGSYSFDGREWTGETVKAFRICTTPDDNLISRLAGTEGWEPKLMEEAGLVRTSEKSGRQYDFFRNRILFPILNHNGKIAGFTGRKRKGDIADSPKYKNSPENEAYHKGNILYGLWQNRRGLREQGALIVEGNADVVTLYDKGIRNVVASGGTALTVEQLRLLKRYTQEVTILFDSDEAGQAATCQAVDRALGEGFRVRVAFFEDPAEDFEEKKYDPDNFVRAYGASSLETFLEVSSQDGLIWRVMLEHDPKDIFKKEAAINLAGQLVGSLDSEVLQDFYIRELTGKDRLGKESATHLKEYIKKEQERKLVEANKPKLTPAQQSDIIRYGIYQNNNQYYRSETVDAEGFPISNFIIRPIMLIVGSQQSARLVEVVNMYGHKFVADINSDDFIDMSTFRRQVERRGNYLFWEYARPEHFVKIKRRLYDEMGACFPISTLGWHKQGFYSWANGIVAGGKFQPIDEYGVVTHGENRFFLPAFSKVNQEVLSDDDDGGYEDQKGFVYVDEIPAPSFREWTAKMVDVHGDNGMIGVAWYLAAIFRDLIYPRFNCFPHLNLFGPPQSGKSYLAWSIAFMFGKPTQPFHLVHGTDVAFYRTLAHRRNAVAWFDEYSNQVYFKRIEALKAAYDGTGRPKGTATADNRTTTTKVNSACIISGQTQPTQDVALFTRCISLNFRSDTTSAEEIREQRRQRGDELKAIEATGCLSQITSELQQYRDEIDTQFDLLYDEIRAELVSRAGRHQVEDRIIKNYAIPLTVVNILARKIDFGFKIVDLIGAAFRNMLTQVESITSQDELSTWWGMMEYFIEQDQLLHDKDLLVQEVTSVTVKANQVGTSETTTVTFEGKKKVLFLRFTSAYRLYMEQLRREGNSGGLNQEAIKYYLKISPAFIGEVRARKFGGEAKSCYAFDMAKLAPFDLPLSILEKGATAADPEPAPARNEDLPF